MTQVSQTEPIILFDGVCLLCESFVQLVLKNDRKGRFKFAPLQGPSAHELMKRANPPPPAKFETIVLVENGSYYYASDAALRILARLRFPWPLLAIARILPRPLRDAVYAFVSKNRYSWFGKRNECMIPTAEMRRRFLD